MDPSDAPAALPGDRCPQCGHEVGDAWLVCAWCGQQLAAAAELVEGARLSDGRYQILRVIGRGGFGITYDVGDRRLQRRVAMKELFPESAVRHGSLVLTPPQGRAGFRAARDRFLREARVLARFTHPGIVRVYEVFEEHGTAYLVMELLEGRTLIELLQQRGKAFPEAEVLDVAGRVAAALRPVHAAGVLHRDVNPSNVMMTHHGRIVVIDFGLARDYDQDQTVGMTRVVTPGYAPIEQYRGEGRFGPSTDVYGLAATCYRLATGKVPVSALEARRRRRAALAAPAEPGHLQAGQRRHPRRPRAGAGPPAPGPRRLPVPARDQPPARRPPLDPARHRAAAPGGARPGTRPAGPPAVGPERRSRRARRRRRVAALRPGRRGPGRRSPLDRRRRRRPRRARGRGRPRRARAHRRHRGHPTGSGGRRPGRHRRGGRRRVVTGPGRRRHGGPGGRPHGRPGRRRRRRPDPRRGAGRARRDPHRARAAPSSTTPRAPTRRGTTRPGTWPRSTTCAPPWPGRRRAWRRRRRRPPPPSTGRPTGGCRWPSAPTARDGAS
ncbi:protein kinase [Aquihabitans sp. G128]|uniref:protein kinase domain-containing protein n=1 Tax=Aquihabitans sp. G128 TaxID=2849779 RepID=UPI001C238F1C|nr:protein kinase [Aquihabitans sp. G128]QXC63214.1 protein kinase [Aquihabitans sp. G128]